MSNEGGLADGCCGMILQFGAAWSFVLGNLYCNADLCLWFASCQRHCTYRLIFLLLDFTTDFTSCGSQNIATRFCRVRCVNGSVKLSCKLAQKWGSISCKVCWAKTKCICSFGYRRSWPCPTSFSASKVARAKDPDGVPGVAQALLGKTLLGQRLFFNHLWKCH